MSALEGNALSLRVNGQEILSEASLSAEPGKLVALLGPNGAGKSTLLRLLAGLAAPDRGTVTLDGRALATEAPQQRARRIGYLPQRPDCAWALTVRQVAALGRLPWRDGPAADAAAVEDALAACDLAPLADRPVSQLSGGEFARAMLARLLAGTPAILLADEPTAGLDPLHTLRVMQTLRDTADSGRAVVVVLHDLALADRFADRVVLLHQGRVAASGRGRDILTAERLRAIYGVEAVIGEIDGARVILPLRPAQTETAS